MPVAGHGHQDRENPASHSMGHEPGGPRDQTPVLFVHGFASTHAATWAEPGWHELMEEIGCRVVPYELPGHGKAPVHHGLDSELLDDLVDHARREGADSAVGFSAGALLLLRAAVYRPEAFQRLVLVGIGDGMWTNPNGFQDVGAALEGDTPDDAVALLRQLAARAGNSLASVASYARSTPPPPSFTALGGLTASTLVLLGDRDPAGPADELTSALRHGTLVPLSRTDHFRAPSSPQTMTAVLDFFTRSGR